MTYLALGSGPVLTMAVLASIAGPAYAQSGWSIRKLTAPGLAHGAAWDLDGEGNIVGELHDAQGVQHAVVWRGGVGEALPGAGGNSTAFAIADTGHVGGFAANATLPTRAACWRPVGAASWDLVDLGTLPSATMSAVYGFGTNRFAVGVVDDGLATLPVVWLDADAPASLRALPLPSGAFGGAAEAVAGAFVYGHVVDGGGLHPARWTRQGRAFTLTQLPSLSPWGVVTDTSSNGRVVGASVSPTSGRVHIVEWSGSGFDDHGTLPGMDCHAEGINARGDVVGWARTFATPPYVAIVRFAGGPIRVLQELAPTGTPWTLARAHAIGDDGTIVGTGVLDGFFEPFVMTPLAVGLEAPRPGRPGTDNKFVVNGLTPFGDVALFASVRGGETPFPGCATGLDLATPLFVGMATAGAGGSASVMLPVPTWVAGLPLWFQAFEPAACAPSNVVAVTFR